MSEHEYDNMLRAQFLRSNHVYLVNTLFGDGSVRTITNDVDLNLYKSLGSRGEQEVVPTTE